MRKKRLLSGLLAAAMTLSVLSGTVTALAAETLPEEAPAVSSAEQEELSGEEEEPELPKETPDSSDPEEEPVPDAEPEEPEGPETPAESPEEKEPEQPDAAEEPGADSAPEEDSDAEQPEEPAEEPAPAKSAAEAAVQTVPYENVRWTNEDGVSFMVDFDQTSQTAYIWEVLKNDSVVECMFPTEIEYDNTTYTVTKVQLIGQQMTGFSKLVLPQKLETFAGDFGIGFPDVTELTIPGTVTTLDASFQDMASLKTLTLKEGVAKLAVSNGFAMNCPDLETVNLPASLKTISGSGAFSGDVSLKNIDLSHLTSLNTASLFEGCTSLKEAALPACVRSIGNSMFKGCTALETVTAKSTITKVEDYAFCGDRSLIAVPDVRYARSIGKEAFKDCVVLPSLDGQMYALYFYACESLGEGAFENCENLSVFGYIGMEHIPDRVFKNAKKMQFVIFRNTNYEGKSLPLPVSIGEEAFMNTKITKFLPAFPTTVQTIGKGAFEGTLLEGTLSLPDSVTSVGSRAFAGTNLEGVSIGSGIRSIGSEAFAECPGLVSAKVDREYENVEVGADAFDEKTTKVNWKEPPLPVSGDTISDKADALTLQQAVDQAAVNGGTVYIEKDITLSQPVTVPAGQTVTITSDKEYRIYGYSPELTTRAAESPLKNLFIVQAGASVVFDGDVVLYGRYNTGSVILNYGKTTLKGNAVVRGSDLQSDTANGLGGIGIGVIDSRGEGAAFYMKGGTIRDNSLSNNAEHSGIVRVSDGAKFYMSAGTITENDAAGGNASNSSAGVLLYGNAGGEMTGGEISRNIGHRGTALMLFTEDGSAGRVDFTIRNGSVCNNTCTSSSSSGTEGSAAVHVEGNAKFTMTGGGITDNHGVKGGGVCVVDPLLQRSNASEGFPTEFILDGGTISGNRATAGGGIYSFSNGVQLLSGYIENNSAGNDGGGVYSEGNASMYSTLHLRNALITENTAEEQGGGVWFCPTGDAKIYVTNGAAIYGNTAQRGARGAGDDFTAATDGSHSITLAGRMLGGGAVHWYQDGSVTSVAGSAGWPTVTNGSRRYDDTEDEVTGIRDYTGGTLSLKGFTTQEAIDAAQAEAQLYIRYNRAYFGGGVGANGGVVIGEDTVLTDLTVNKEWDDDEDALSARPESVTVELKDLSGHVLDSAVLSAENGWSHTFKELPLGVYTAEEQEVPEGYRESLHRNSDGSLTIVNTFEPEEPHEPGHISILPDPLDPDPGPEEPGEEEPGTETEDPENPKKPKKTILDPEHPGEEDPEHPETETPEDPEQTGTGEEQPDSQDTGTTAPEAGGTAETTDETTSESRAAEENVPEEQTAEDKRPRLIQTGQPWTPVWALAAAGAALTAVGLWLTKRRK